jgi:hypothetical protein
MRRYTSDGSPDTGCGATRKITAYYGVFIDERDDFLEVNLTTGDYRFTSCSGFTMSGMGVIDQRGGGITLRHNAGDRRQLANIKTVVNSGKASIRVLSEGARFQRDCR